VKSQKKNSGHKPASRSAMPTKTELYFLLLLLAYVLVVTFTPNWMAVDTNATKFLSLSVVNLFGFTLLLVNKTSRNPSNSIYKLLDTNLGLVYLGFLVFTVLSFTQAINIVESFLHFSKIFSVFTAAWVVGYIFVHYPVLVRYTAILMVGLLLFDAISVYYYIAQYIDGKIGNISEIKTIYSNKNILASSIYVKLPFALWLCLFDRGGLKVLSWLALFCGVLATFFLSSRSFFLGLMIISVILIIFSLLNFYRKKEKKHLQFIAIYLGAIIFANVLFTFVQNVYYPTSNDRYHQGVLEQVGTLTSEVGYGNGSLGLRAQAWIWSLELIKQNPILGVGSGNWKIAILEYENQKNPGFIYMYKAHNDFLENMAEVGLIGGLLFLFIFLFAGWNFIRYYNKAIDEPDDIFKLLFIAASGLAFYGVDAMFNFPADRPEILLLFALFVAAGMAGTWLRKENAEENELNTRSFKLSFNLSSRSWLHYVIGIIVIGICTLVIYVFQQNYVSNKLQRIVLQEITAGALKQPSSVFLSGFPAIPNVGAWGESISSMVARYLINEKKFKETISLLKDDQQNPYDSRREYFMALAYNGLGVKDSALYYARWSYNLKPYHQRNTYMMLGIMEQLNMTDSIPKYLDHHLAAQKDDPTAFVAAVNFFIKIGNQERASALIQEAKSLHPSDSNVTKLYQKLNSAQYQAIFSSGARLYNSKRYREAAKEFELYFSRVPDDVNGYKLLVFSYYNSKNYSKCIETINVNMGRFPQDAEILNLRGVAYKEMNKVDLACADFKTAISMGNAPAKSNFDRICQN
jgi:O-antigen ligase